MNAIVALCHFCEQHGPSVIMCTQPYKQRQPQYLNSTSGDQPQTNQCTDVGVICKDVFAIEDRITDVNSLPDASIDLIASASKTMSTAHSQHPTVANANCKACASLQRDDPGIVSHDQVANISYISTQCLKDPDLNTCVMNACVRSLAGEVYPDTEGAFYFGDETNGHVISYNFHISDSQARGNQSRFSILVLSWDRIYLLNLWPFLVSNLSRMVSRIRASANRVFSNETSDNRLGSAIIGPSSNPSHAISTASNRRCATPPATLAPVPYGQAIAAANALTTSSNLFYQSTGEGQRHRRADDADMRSLIDLTKDDQVFCRIHAWFTWLLRAGGRRWNVVSSLTSILGDEDSLITKERQQALIVAGAEHLSSLGNINSALGNQHKLSVGAFSQSSAVSNSSQLPPTLWQSLSNSSLGDSNVNRANDVYRYEQENATSLMVLARLFNALGINPFRRLIQHIAIGNQVVVQPLEEAYLGAITICALAKLLPIGCCKQVVDSVEYLAPFRCNLLGMNPDVVTTEPESNAVDGVIFLSVYRFPKPLDDGIDHDSPSIDKFVHSLYFRLCSTLPNTNPDIVVFKEMRASSRSARPIAVTTHELILPIPVSSFVDQLVRLFSINPPLTPTTLDLALQTIKHEWISRARLLYSFKRCQGPNINGDEANRRWTNVLASINCSLPENSAVARFWQGSLSQYSRNHVCHVRKRLPTSTSTSRRTSCCSSNPELNAPIVTSSLVD